MKTTFSGKILYANGAAIPGVEVRVYDKDAEGKGDDDLTVSAGLSDEEGRFTVTFEPTRYLDFHTIDISGTPSLPFNASVLARSLRFPDLTDVYLPYLRFGYTFKDEPREHVALLVPFQSEFRLPENPPVEFMPSQAGFRFVNSFSGYFLPFSIPNFAGPKKVPPTYGLCGGMSCAAYDFLLAGREIPSTGQVPNQGTRLQRYLYQRQIDSFGGLGSAVVKVAQWTTLPDETTLGTYKRTADEVEGIRARLDDQNLVVLALIYESASSVSELAKVIFSNHQVLAYGYTREPGGGIQIQVYDPNHPERDDVVIKASQIALGEATTSAGPTPVFGLQSVQKKGSQTIKQVRGFFPMSYVPIEPPPKL